MKIVNKERNINFPDINLDGFILEILYNYPYISDEIKKSKVYYYYSDNLNENSIIISYGGSQQNKIEKIVTECNSYVSYYTCNYMLIFNLNNINKYDRENLSRFMLNFERWIRSQNTKLDLVNDYKSNIQLLEIDCGNAQLYEKEQNLNIYQIQINFKISEVFNE